MAQVIGVLPSLTHTLFYINMAKTHHTQTLCNIQTYKHANIYRDNTHLFYKKTEGQCWVYFGSVLYGREAGTLLVASFLLKPDPSTSVSECLVVVLQALHHCLDCFSACRIRSTRCLFPLSSPAFFKSTQSDDIFSNHTPPMNCAVITQKYFCICILTHTVTHTHTHTYILC